MELDIGWHRWKKTLSQAVHTAEFVGLSQERISDLAYRMGEFLAKNIDPGNREQRLLIELWNVAGEDEKRTLANLLIRMVERVDGGDGQIQ